ncbi:THAP domain-containing protein 5 [Nematolebias whitei]|uniref:THAP domain-containing protein 5 n=1 Tax=Nematolebias whitei TaxID=451745 RepID=UPI00189B34D2|nr:THAP domain-containing protein 5 [Nematolebias whitei]
MSKFGTEQHFGISRPRRFWQLGSVLSSWLFLTRFPLQDPVRLQRWLRNMGRENWTPSRHQYVCHEHFSPSCFKVRWGVRYLESDAVPTVFQLSPKRKAADQTERKPKRLRVKTGRTGSGDGSSVLDGVQIEHGFHTVQLFEVSVDQSQPAESGLDPGDIRGPYSSLQVDPQGPGDTVDTGLNVPLTFCQREDGPINSMDGAQLVLVPETQDELVKRSTAAILGVGPSVVLDLPRPEESGPSWAEEFSKVHECQEVIAYFETIPNVLPSETSTRFSVSPDTVLSSALSSKPILSTLPIVSKHVPPSSTLPIVSKHVPTSSLVLTLEPLDSEEGDGAAPEDVEQEDQQLEEHRYHRTSLSKEQLEAVVAELQKKVKVLQQRHRRHLEKLLGLENTVSQLRQNNLLNEERLQLLERAYQQTTAAASGPGETVTIIYEDDTAYLYTPAHDEGTMLAVDISGDCGRLV